MGAQSQPENIDLNFADFQRLGNGILPRLDAMRERDRIFWSEVNQAWIVSGHAEIGEAAAGHLPLSCDRLVQVTVGKVPEQDRARLYPTIMHYMPNWIISFDPPRHTRLRKLIVKSLNRKVLNALRPFIEARVQQVMERLEREPEIEFNEQIARNLTGGVILELLGLPQENQDKLREWGNALLEAAGNPNATHEQLLAMDAAMAEMNVMLGAEIEKRRVNPRVDLLSALVEARDEGDQLTTDEMLGALHVLVIAGHDSTMNTTSLGLETLSRNPEFWDYMYRHPEQTNTCVLELMRRIAMMTSQSRFVSEDFEWHGKRLRKGQVLFMMLCTGNRDPEIFPDPEKLDPGRDAIDQSLVFNPGLHHCLGHGLAKLQLGIFFAELVRRFEGAELLDDALAFLPGIAFRGLYHLNVRMKPRNPGPASGANQEAGL